MFAKPVFERPAWPCHLPNWRHCSPLSGSAVAPGWSSPLIWPCPVGGIAAGLKLAAGCRRLVRVRADAAECLPFGAAELVGGRAEGVDEGGQGVGAAGIASISTVRRETAGRGSVHRANASARARPVCTGPRLPSPTSSGLTWPHCTGRSLDALVGAEARGQSPLCWSPAGPGLGGRWGLADSPCGICGLLSLWPLGRSRTGRVIPSVGVVPELPALPTPPTPQARATRVARVSGRNDDPMKQTTKETAVITPTARVTAARLAIRAARPRRLTSTLLWAAQILLAAFSCSLLPGPS